jgi:hypothetical protein
VTQDIDNVLAENLASMEKSITWLKRSGRYARTIDVIVNKVFRSIDAVELEDGGTTSCTSMRPTTCAHFDLPSIG